MRLELRYYKRFDADLLALIECGVNLNRYLPAVLKAYAAGKEIHLYIPFCKSHDLSGEQRIHTSLQINDPDSIRLLKQVKYGYRNAFCKMLLRDALVYQNFGVFFSRDEYIRKEYGRVKKADLSDMDNVITVDAKGRTRSSIEKELGFKETGKKIKRGPEGNTHTSKKPIKTRGQDTASTTTIETPENSKTFDEMSMEDIITAERTMQEEQEAQREKTTAEQNIKMALDDDPLYDVFQSMIEGGSK